VNAHAVGVRATTTGLSLSGGVVISSPNGCAYAAASAVGCAGRVQAMDVQARARLPLWARALMECWGGIYRYLHAGWYQPMLRRERVERAGAEKMDNGERSPSPQMGLPEPVATCLRAPSRREWRVCGSVFAHGGVYDDVHTRPLCHPRPFCRVLPPCTA